MEANVEKLLKEFPKELLEQLLKELFLYGLNGRCLRGLETSGGIPETIPPQNSRRNSSEEIPGKLLEQLLKALLEKSLGIPSETSGDASD